MSGHRSRLGEVAVAVFVEIDGKRVECPAGVRAAGAAAIRAWEKEQRQPAKKKGTAAGGDK